MKKELIGLNYKGKREKLEVFKVPKWLEGIGLMFSRKEKARALLFSFEKLVGLRIHSCFVFYDFVAIWLDKNREVIDFKKVKPFSFNVWPKKKFKYLIEIPINRKYDAVLKLLVGKRNI